MRLEKFIMFIIQNGYSVEFKKDECFVDFGKGYIFRFDGNLDEIMDQVSFFIKNGRHLRELK